MRSRTQAYNLCTYNSELLGKNIPVFIQAERGKDPTYTINNEFQFGVDGEVFFLVNHDKEHRGHGIYQWRFFKEAGGLSALKNVGEGILGAIGKAGGEYLGIGAVDLSWIAGDPLRDF